MNFEKAKGNTDQHTIIIETVADSELSALKQFTSELLSGNHGCVVEGRGWGLNVDLTMAGFDNGTLPDQQRYNLGSTTRSKNPSVVQLQHMASGSLHK